MTRAQVLRRWFQRCWLLMGLLATCTGCMGQWLNPAMQVPLTGLTGTQVAPSAAMPRPIPPLVQNQPKKPPSARQTPDLNAVVPHGEHDPAPVDVAKAAAATDTGSAPDGPSNASLAALVAPMQGENLPQSKPTQLAQAAVPIPQPSSTPASENSSSKSSAANQGKEADAPAAAGELAQRASTSPPRPVKSAIPSRLAGSSTELDLPPVEALEFAPVPAGLSQSLNRPLADDSTHDLLKFTETPHTGQASNDSRQGANRSGEHAASRADDESAGASVRFRDDPSDALPVPPDDWVETESIDGQSTSSANDAAAKSNSAQPSKPQPSKPAAAKSPAKQSKGWTAVATDAASQASDQAADEIELVPLTPTTKSP